RQVTNRLSKDLNTRIEVKYVDFSLFNNMHLRGVLIEDQQKDTILSASEVRIRITDWFFFKKNIVLKYVGLENAVIKLQDRKSTRLNSSHVKNSYAVFCLKNKK